MPIFSPDVYPELPSVSESLMRMGYQQQNTVHGMSLDTPWLEDNTLIALGTPYQQIMNSAGPARMSWSTTDPTLLVTEHSWKYRGTNRAPDYHSDLNNGNLQISEQLVDDYSNLQSSSDLTNRCFAPMYELSHALQFYSLGNQDRYNELCIPTFIAEAMSEQPPKYLEEANSFGSNNMAKENWRVESGTLRLAECAPELCKVIPDFFADKSLSVVSDEDALCNCSMYSQRLVGMQHDNLLPLPDSRMFHNQADGDDMLHFGGDRLTQSTSFGMLPWSTTISDPSFRRQTSFSSSWNDRERAVQPVLDDPMQFPLITDKTRRLESPLNPLSSAKPCKEIKISGRPALPCQGMTGGYERVRPAKRPGSFGDERISIEPQSVAARHRRKRISERFRVLEKLIPGGNKMDTATMLDEAIDYVKFLQLQVQLLESLGDMEESTNPALTSSLLAKGTKRKANARGDILPSYITALPMRSVATSPLILSEVLQQQLFKQKLCLVSIRQCPPCSCPSSRGLF